MKASDGRLRVAVAMAAAFAARGVRRFERQQAHGALAACGSGAKAATAPAPATSGSWPYPNGDLANTRVAAGSTISSANVSRLAQAWTFKLTGKAAAGVRPYGSLAANPIVQNGVVYLQDLDSNVYALALSTGKLEWECRLDHAREERTRAERRRGRRRRRLRSHADHGVRAERRDRPGDLGQQQAAA